MSLLKVSPFLLLAFANLFWSLNFIIGKLVADAIPPGTITLFRWGLPLLLFLAFSWTDIRENRQVYRNHWLLLLCLGATGYGLNSISVYGAVLFTSTINTSFINAFNPVFIAVAGSLCYRYPITFKQMIGFLLSLAGVIWIIFKGNPALIIALNMNIGDLMMLGSVVSWTIHTILYKRYANLFPSKSLFTVMMLAGVIFMLPITLIENWDVGTDWVAQVRLQHIIGILCLSIFPSVLAYRFWNMALDRVSTNQVAVSQYLIPVYTVIISLLFLNERLQPFQIIGGFLIFIGVFLVNSPGAKRKTV